ncbi:MAG TPA: DUF58 domain-containing protein [Methylomirabilota bacterium]|nr:DUF58 domain-containing protein [Methylomirabilota bacterium]
MNRFSYRIYRMVSSLRHVSARRLTPAGWIVLIGLILTAGMATDTEQSLGYQVFALLLCLAIAAVAAAPFFRVRFAAERMLPKYGSAGQPLRYAVFIHNRSVKVQAGLHVLDGLVDPRPTFEEFLELTPPAKRRKSLRLTKVADVRRVRAIKPQVLPALAPNGTAAVEIELVPLKRGVLHFDSVAIARPDPFMLFRAFSTVKLPASFTILPRRYSLPHIALPGSPQYQHGGVALAVGIGESEEFVSLRDYRPGDPLRRIHWRSWAKAGRPVVKEFQDEFFVRHALILDTFVEPEKAVIFEEAVSIAASFACAIDTQESLLDLLFIGPQAFCFTIGRGVAHADQMLELLASVKTCADKPFSSLQQLVVEHATTVSGCVCIFVAWDEARRQLVRKLSALGVPALILVLRENGSAAPERDVDDPENLHVLEVGNMEADLAKI